VILAGTLATLSVVGAGFVYGAILAPSARDGAQPIEFFDVGYYSALGADLARTGVESIYSPSGFGHLPDLPEQTWYHWGELWLAAAAITIFDIQATFARHFVALPLVLLAAATLAGTLVRRMTGTSSRGAFVLGAGACLFLAPILLPYPGPFFTKWASGLLFGITQYGLGAVTALLGLYLWTVPVQRTDRWALSLSRAAISASVIPAHLVLAVMWFAGFAGARGQRVLRLLSRQGQGHPPALDWRAIATFAVVIAVTIGWGAFTGHGVGASALSASTSAFSDTWREVVIRTAAGFGVFLAIPVAWFVVRAQGGVEPTAYVFALVSVIAGAIAWGARYGDLNMFHTFFGALAVLAAPIAAAALWRLWNTARMNARRGWAAFLFVVLGVQLGLNVSATITRLYAFSPPQYEPISVQLLDAIRGLPANAKLAYACGSLDEASFWDPSLVSLYAHTGRPVVPMCFQAEFFGWLITGRDSSPVAENPLFEFAPQRAIYPNAEAQPSVALRLDFLEKHGIGYVYIDADHPNDVVPGALPVAARGSAAVLQVPSSP
jgi:hypothetical protein